MTEIEDIIIAMTAIVAAFAIANWGLGVFVQDNLLLRLTVLFFTVGIGFISHELGHKFLAERNGAFARFIMWPQGLIFMLAVSVFGLLFAAPGAVYIFKNNLSKKQNGVISLAGPVVNILLYIFFALVLFGSAAAGIELAQIVKVIAAIGMQINALLAFFNLLPIFILDGAKVFSWNKGVWAAAFLLSLGLMTLSPGFGSLV